MNKVKSVDDNNYFINRKVKGAERDWWLAQPNLSITIKHLPRRLHGKHIRIHIEVVGEVDNVCNVYRKIFRTDDVTKDVCDECLGMQEGF